MRAKEFARHIFEQVKSNWYIPVTEHQVYSTAEQKIGVWTDGKPIYKKTFTDSFAIPDAMGSLTDKVVELSTYGIANINEIIKVEGMLDYGDSSTRTELPWSNSNNVVTLVQTLENTKIRYRNTYKSNNTLLGIITLYYTKTTDTATSPKVPYEPLHEWSTEEKLVGYWIDGKAVYEKTVRCGALPNATDKTIAHGISNIKEILSMSGCASGPSDGTILTLPHADTTATACIGLMIKNSNILIRTGSNRSNFTTSYVTLRYTKTT